MATRRSPAKGRTQRSAEQWRSIIRRFDQSGLQPNDFCRRESLARSTFDLRRRRMSQGTPSSGFVELKQSPQDINATADSWTLEVDLPGGVHLCFRGGR